MLVKRRLGFVFLSLVAGALSAVVATGGCQSDETGNGSDNNDGPGASGPGASGSGGSSSSAQGGNGNDGNTGGTGNTGGGSGDCNPAAATIQDITGGTVGPDVEVKLEGVVAMSHKFLVGSAKGPSCLWGVYVSAPGITETAANTGLLVIAYGDEAVTSDEGTFCPKLGVEPTGGNIPDDTLPGDTLTLVGKTSAFLLDDCATEPNGSSVKAIQVGSHSSSCPTTKTGTAPVPTAHLMSGADVAKLASASDKAFHDMWGGVKVRIEDAAVVAESNPYVSGCDSCCPSGVTPPCVVNSFGQIHLASGDLLVGSDPYYRGYLKDENICHASPVFSTSVTSFNSIEGFSSLDFCFWTLQVHDKCADLDPQSEDCTAPTCTFTGD